MTLVFNGKKKKIHFKNSLLFILFLVLFIYQHYPYLWNLYENGNNLIDNKVLLLAQGSDEDTTSPIITFNKPVENNTIINFHTLFIEVSISDDNPPLNGSVIVQISNKTTSLFNATMFYESENIWYYYWNNVSAYPNGVEHIIQIWAKDSSLAENLGKSEEYYVYIDLSKSPGKLYLLMYIIIVSLIFTGICIYISKKAPTLRIRTKKLN